jgi:hypothetical protein
MFCLASGTPYVEPYRWTIILANVIWHAYAQKPAGEKSLANKRFWEITLATKKHKKIPVTRTGNHTNVQQDNQRQQMGTPAISDRNKHHTSQLDCHRE